MAMFMLRDRGLEAEILRIYREERHRTSCARLSVDRVRTLVYIRRKAGAVRILGLYWATKPGKGEIRRAIHHLQADHSRMFSLRSKSGQSAPFRTVPG
jgi:hypothetical protein